MWGGAEKSDRAGRRAWFSDFNMSLHRPYNAATDVFCPATKESKALRNSGSWHGKVVRQHPEVAQRTDLSLWGALSEFIEELNDGNSLSSTKKMAFVSHMGSDWTTILWRLSNKANSSNRLQNFVPVDSAVFLASR